jgi:hypothetical protein
MAPSYFTRTNNMDWKGFLDNSILACSHHRCLEREGYMISRLFCTCVAWITTKENAEDVIEAKVANTVRAALTVLNEPRKKFWNIISLQLLLYDAHVKKL